MEARFTGQLTSDLSLMVPLAGVSGITCRTTCCATEITLSGEGDPSVLMWARCRSLPWVTVNKSTAWLGALRTVAGRGPCTPALTTRETRTNRRKATNKSGRSATPHLSRGWQGSWRSAIASRVEMRARKPGNSGRLVIRFLVCAAIGAATALVWREIDSDRESARRGVTGRDSSTTLDRSRVDRPPPPRPSPSAGSSRTVRAVLDAFAAARVSGAQGSDSARYRPLRRADVARASRRREHVQPGRRHSEGASIREVSRTRLIWI